MSKTNTKTKSTSVRTQKRDTKANTENRLLDLGNENDVIHATVDQEVKALGEMYRTLAIYTPYLAENQQSCALRNGMPVHVFTKEFAVANSAAWAVRKFASFWDRYNGEDIFSPEMFMRGIHFQTYQEHDLATMCVTLAMTDFDLIDYHFPNHEQTPVLSIIRALIEKYDLQSFGLISGEPVTDPVRATECATAFNAAFKENIFGDDVVEFAALTNTLSAKAERKEELLAEHLIECMKSSPCQVGIRLDLHAQYAVCSCEPDVEGTYVKAEDMLLFRRQIDDFLQHGELNHLITGYALNVEHSLRNNFFIHLVLLINVSESVSRKQIVECISSFWCKEITDGFGMVFDCEEHFSFRTAGTGLKLSDCPSHHREMRAIAATICQPEKILRLELPNGQPTLVLGKGIRFAKTELIAELEGA